MRSDNYSPPPDPELDPERDDPALVLGEWSVERLIEDRRAGTRSYALGTASLVREEPDRILWTEHTKLTHAGSEFDASRQLVLVRDGDDWHVHFDHGGYFHPWRPGETVHHPCGEDAYEGQIRLDDPPSPDAPIDCWRIFWRVTGPRKDLAIEVVLSRLDLEPSWND